MTKRSKRCLHSHKEHLLFIYWQIVMSLLHILSPKTGPIENTYSTLDLIIASSVEFWSPIKFGVYDSVNRFTACAHHSGFDNEICIREWMIATEKAHKWRHKLQFMWRFAFCRIFIRIKIHWGWWKCGSVYRQPKRQILYAIGSCFVYIIHYFCLWAHRIAFKIIIIAWRGNTK